MFKLSTLYLFMFLAYLLETTPISLLSIWMC